MLFLIPSIASAVLLIVLWRGGDLSRPGLSAAACTLGFCLQFFSESFSLRWLAGLLVNVVIAVCLSIKLKLSW